MSFKHPEPLVEVSKSIFTKKRKFEKKKNHVKNFETEIFQFSLVPIGSGVSGIFFYIKKLIFSSKLKNMKI